MFGVVISSSRNSDNREIDEYHDSINDSGSSSNNSRSYSNSSSRGNTTDE